MSKQEEKAQMQEQKKMLKALERFVEEMTPKPRPIGDFVSKESYETCYICDTREDLYSVGETQLILRLVPHLQLFTASTAKPRICKNCCKRFIRIRVYIYNAAEQRTFVKAFDYNEDLLKLCVEKQIKTKLSIKKAEFNKVYKGSKKKPGLLYREMRNRVIADTMSRLYEGIDRPKRRRKPKERPTLKDFASMLLSVTQKEPTRKKAISLKAFVAHIKGVQVEYDYPLTAESYHKGFERERAELANPCKFCTKAVCDPDCEHRAYFYHLRHFGWREPPETE